MKIFYMNEDVKLYHIFKFSALLDEDPGYNREMFGLSVRDITESEVQINMKIPASPDVLD